MAGHAASMRKRRGAYKILAGRPQGRRTLGIPRGRWRIILQWIFKKWIGVGGMDWIYLTQEG